MTDHHVIGVPDPGRISASASSRCIACEEIELANAQDARPSQMLPIPHMALAGFPDGRSPHHLTRRRLLQFGAAGVASVYASKLLSWGQVWESVAEAAASPPPSALVVLYLAGGQDGLNVVVPNSSTDYPIYVKNRPVLYRAQGPSTGGRVGSMLMPGTGGDLAFANPVVSSKGGGDNGDATHGFDVIYGNGLGGTGSNLAILPAVDYMPPNLSHFTSGDYWFGGALEMLPTGWLGRYLDAYGSPTNPLQGISIGTSLFKALVPASAPVCNIPSLSTLGFSMQGGSPGGDPAAVDANALVNMLAGAATSPGNIQLTHTRESYQLAIDVYQQTRSLPTFTAGTGYPANSTLAPQLALAAFLLAQNLGTRVITIVWGSFDTHGDQLPHQDPQLKDLSVSLSAFLADLKARGIDNRVSVLMFSEFGRRVAENASAGTDHGAGGLMMLAGTPVKGGFAAPFPGLSTLDQVGDVLVPTDFRSVYQETISEWLGGDPAAVLPDGPFPEITRFDGTTGLFN